MRKNTDYVVETSKFAVKMLEIIRASEDYELHWQMFADCLEATSKTVRRALEEYTHALNPRN